MIWPLLANTDGYIPDPALGRLAAGRLGRLAGRLWARRREDGGQSCDLPRRTLYSGSHVRDAKLREISGDREIRLSKGVY